MEIIISQKKMKLLSLKKQQGSVRQKLKKIKKLSTHISTKMIMELNELIYGGGKLFCDKIGEPLENNRNSKPGWKITGNADKKSMTTNKISKTEEKRENI